MFKTTVTVIPKHIRSALDDVLDYVMPAEADDYHATPKARRKGHIYTTLQTIHQWLKNIPAKPDTVCSRQHSAEIGINWDVIRCHADDLFPEREAV